MEPVEVQVLSSLSDNSGKITLTLMAPYYDRKGGAAEACEELSPLRCLVPGKRYHISAEPAT